MYYAFVSAISILSVIGTIASGFWVLFKLAKGEGATSKGVVADVSLLISIASAAGSFLALRGVPEEEFDPSKHMVNLAEKVSRVEGERWQRLLGGWHTINVEFAYIKPPYRAPALSPSAPGQELESVVQDFRQTFPQRVLITGDPGAGKTVLAIRLILDILRDRKPEDPIPVLFSLAEWDTRMSLTGFAARMLERSYGIRRDLAQALIEARKILPVLDGLDEMDKSDAAVDASRAARALEHMNEYQSGATAGALIVTCRSAEYERLERAGHRLYDDAQMHILPVSAEKARKYLADKATDARWEPLLATLQAYPAGTLARALSTPWRLTLAAIGYAASGDPGELQTLGTARQIDEHLLRRFIPSSFDLHAKGRPAGSPADVHRHLSTLARHLVPAAGATSTVAAQTDLILHELWRMGGVSRVRRADLIGTLMLLGVLYACTVTAFVSGAAKLPEAIFVSLIPLVACAVAASRTTLRPPIGVKLPDGNDSAVRTVAAVVLVALGLIWVFLGTAVLTISVFLALMVGGLYLRFLESSSTALGPEDPLRMEMNFSLVVAVTVSAVPGALLFFGGLLIKGYQDHVSFVSPARNLPALLGASGFLGGMLLLGIPVAFWLVGVNVRRYTAFRASSRRSAPPRLFTLMRWSYEAGLLRKSGISYQFRHRELQEWLARHQNPPS
ncbi:NACHT domain-containing protein [Streptomyces sp. NPDC014846]